MLLPLRNSGFANIYSFIHKESERNFMPGKKANTMNIAGERSSIMSIA